MNFVRFKNANDRAHWNREFARKGSISILRGQIYVLTTAQFRELEEASVDVELISRQEVDGQGKDNQQQAETA